jgi:hypothetical protein
MVKHWKDIGIMLITSYVGAKSTFTICAFVIMLSFCSPIAASWSTQVEWSPDGMQLVLVDGQSVTVLDEMFQVVETAPIDNRRGFDKLAWSPSGNHLIIGRDIWQVNPLAKLRTIDLPYNQLLGWNRDGSQVYAYGDDALGIAIYDAQYGNFVRSVYPQINHPNVLDEIAWSPDNRYFAAITRQRGQGLLIIFDAATGNLISQYPNESSSFDRGWAGTIVWNPMGHEVVFGFRAQVELGTPGSSPSPQPPPLDGAFLPVTVVMDVETGQENLILNAAPIDYGYYQWNRAGTELIGSTVSGVFAVWSRSTGQIIDSFALGIAARPVEVALSPYEGRLAVSLGTFIASNDPALQTLANDDLSRAQLFLNDTLAIVVPAPSPDRLRSISTACGLPVSVRRLVDDLGSFTAQVAALPDTQIPPGCRADLLAVAAALQAQ